VASVERLVACVIIGSVGFNVGSIEDNEDLDGQFFSHSFD